MPKTVAVTGGSGFVGGHVIAHFLAAGWRVRAMSRRGGRDLPRDAEVVRGTLEDRDSLASLVAGADVVIHCAGLIKARRRRDFFRVNAQATARLAAVCAAHGSCTRFVYVSSLAARRPELSAYAASKAEGEHNVRALADRLPWTIVRPPAVYGPADREIVKFLRPMRRGFAFIPGALDARLSLIYVDDLCAALAVLAGAGTGEGEKSPLNGRVFEVDDGTPHGYTWRQIVTSAARVLGRPVRALAVPRAALMPVAGLNQGVSALWRGAPMLTPGKVRELYYPQWVCSGESLTAFTSWKPNVTILEGFKRAVAWYQQNGWL